MTKNRWIVSGCFALALALPVRAFDTLDEIKADQGFSLGSRLLILWPNQGLGMERRLSLLICRSLSSNPSLAR
jgi:hypothetical protein